GYTPFLVVGAGVLMGGSDRGLGRGYPGGAQLEGGHCRRDRHAPAAGEGGLHQRRGHPVRERAEGTFWKGGGGGERGETQVTIPHDVQMGVYEVTQQQWEAVLRAQSNPSAHRGPYFPVENVSYLDVKTEFLRELNKKESVASWLYRLPTEDKWEYSCRAGA